MKKLNKLYKILLKEYTESHGGYLCIRINFYLSASWVDRELLLQHFKSQKPTDRLHVEFFNHPLFIKHSDNNGAWWKDHTNREAGKKVRIEFLEKMIEITSIKKLTKD